MYASTFGTFLLPQDDYEYNGISDSQNICEVINSKPHLDVAMGFNYLRYYEYAAVRRLLYRNVLSRPVLLCVDRVP